MRRKAGTTVLAAAGGVLTAALCGPLGAGAETRLCNLEK